MFATLGFIGASSAVGYFKNKNHAASDESASEKSVAEKSLSEEKIAKVSPVVPFHLKNAEALKVNFKSGDLEIFCDSETVEIQIDASDEFTIENVGGVCFIGGKGEALISVPPSVLSVSAATTSGDIIVRDIENASEISVSSVSGDIELLNLSALKVTAASVSGDIYYDIGKNENFVFSSVSGKIVSVD